MSKSFSRFMLQMHVMSKPLIYAELAAYRVPTALPIYRHEMTIIGLSLVTY